MSSVSASEQKHTGDDGDVEMNRDGDGVDDGDEIVTPGASSSKRQGRDAETFADGVSDDDPAFAGPPANKRTRNGGFVDQDGNDDDRRLDIVKAAGGITMTFPFGGGGAGGWPDTFPNIHHNSKPTSGFGAMSNSFDMDHRGPPAPGGQAMQRFSDKGKKDEEMPNFIDNQNTSLIHPMIMARLAPHLYGPLESLGRVEMERFMHREKSPLIVDKDLIDVDNPNAIGVMTIEAFNLAMRGYYHSLYASGRLEEDKFPDKDAIANRFDICSLLNNLSSLSDNALHAAQTGGISLRGSAHDITNYWKAYPCHRACMASLGFAIMKVNMQSSAKWEAIECDDPRKFAPLLVYGNHDRVPRKQAPGETSVENELGTEVERERRIRAEMEELQQQQRPKGKDTPKMDRFEDRPWYAWQAVPVATRHPCAMTDELTVGTRGLGTVFKLGHKGMYMREVKPLHVNLHEVMQCISPASVKDVIAARMRAIATLGGISLFLNKCEDADDPEWAMTERDCRELEDDSNINLDGEIPRIDMLDIDGDGQDGPGDASGAGGAGSGSLNLPARGGGGGGGGGGAASGPVPRTGGSGPSGRSKGPAIAASAAGAAQSAPDTKYSSRRITPGRNADDNDTTGLPPPQPVAARGGGATTGAPPPSAVATATPARSSVGGGGGGGRSGATAGGGGKKSKPASSDSAAVGQ